MRFLAFFLFLTLFSLFSCFENNSPSSQKNQTESGTIKIDESKFENTDTAYILSLIDTAIGFFRKDSERFLKYAEMAHGNFKKLPVKFPDIEEYSTHILSVAYLEVGDYNPAYNYSKKSSELAEQLGLFHKIPGKLINQAIALRFMGRYEDAVEKLDSAIAKTNIQSNVLSAYNELGLLYIEIDSFAKAEWATHKALEIKLAELKKQKKGTDAYNEHLHWVSLSYFNFGQLYNHWGKYEEAVNYLNKCHEIQAGQLNSKSGKDFSNLYFQFGRSYLGRKKYDTAIDYFQKSILALSPSFDVENIAAVPNLGAGIFDRFQLIYPLVGKGRASHNICKKSNEKKHLETATQTYQVASNLIDTIRQSFSSKTSKETLMETARLVFEGAIEHAIYAYEKTGDEKYLAEAFDYAERSKAVVLNEGMNDRKLKSGLIPQDTIEMENKLKNEIAALEKEIQDGETKGNISRDSLKILRKKKSDKKMEWDNFLEILKIKYPAYFNAKYNYSIASFSDVQNFLKKPGEENTTLVEYFMGDSTLVIFGISADDVICHKKRYGEELKNNLEKYRSIVADTLPPPIEGTPEWSNDFREFVRLSTQLYDKLLAPVLKDSKAQNIAIIPDGLLSYLPFHTLLTHVPDDEIMEAEAYSFLPYLFMEKNIRTEYSATLLTDNSPENNAVKYDIPYVGFAPKYGDGKKESQKEIVQAESENDDELRSGLSPLKHNHDEVENAEKLFGGKSFIHEHATEDNFKTNAKSAAILHLSMHGVVDDENPLYSRLVFTKTDDGTEGGSLHAYEIYNMDLRADLAVLSACNTGYGKLKRGEGVMSLSRAFKYAGCPNILMTLWPADDKSTSQLVGAFFKELKNGKRKDEALGNSVKIYLGEKDGRKAHPFYWAQFILIGDNMPVETGGIDSSNYIFYLGGFILILLLLYFWRKT